jgi:hypothetical protein
MRTDPWLEPQVHAGWQSDLDTCSPPLQALVFVLALALVIVAYALIPVFAALSRYRKGEE